ncbi:MAG: hypothetical protein P8X55_02430 [Desulfosarcinaceae bacterium]
MKKILHLLFSEPDEVATRLISAMMDREGGSVACLYPDPVSAAPVDWDRFLEDVFSHDRIICWW